MASYHSDSTYEDCSEEEDEEEIAISEVMSEKEQPHILVAAIDFGTTFSGYAFSFTNKPETIHMNRNWGQNLGFQSYKTATSVLVGPDGEFKAFGYEAEQRYSELVEESNAGGHEMFRHFKMMLHKDGVSRKSKINSVRGVSRNAMDIFAMSLKYLKNHLKEAVGKYITSSLEDHHIKWVITVPAIWTDEAKQFMREAAHKAGLIDSTSSRKMSVALEPEAASVYCKSLDIDHFTEGSNIKTVSFGPGTKYMVIDAGGGTIDITAYEVLVSRQLRELHAANGGPWGGTQVDNNFITLMKDILGEKFIKIYQKDCPKQWLTLMTAFESSKKVVKIGEETKIVIPLSWSMGGKYREVMDGKDIEQVIRKASNTGVSFENGSFVIGREAVENLFNPVVSKIVEHIESIFEMRKMRKCQYILLVGGFAECGFLQKSITEKFSSMKVLIPAEAQMAVIKGAVLFGHKPSHIYSRIARKTYGNVFLTQFIEEIHSPKYIRVIEDRVYCDKLFDIFVQQGEEVKVGKVITSKCIPAKTDQENMGFKLYSLDRKASTNTAEYVDTPGFTRVGNLGVNMPLLTGGRNRRVELTISFGGTEIYLFAKDRTSGSTANTTIDFLSD